MRLRRRANSSIPRRPPAAALPTFAGAGRTSARFAGAAEEEDSAVCEAGLPPLPPAPWRCEPAAFAAARAYRRHRRALTGASAVCRSPRRSARAARR
eukprot:11972237-Alexandrium_andersonii.AAC.1